MHTSARRECSAIDELCARFEHEWWHGDRSLARALARDYVAAHEQHLVTILEGRSLADLVTVVEEHRAAGREEERVVVDMWLLARFEPQQITGAIHIGPAAQLGRGTQL